MTTSDLRRRLRTIARNRRFSTSRLLVSFSIMILIMILIVGFGASVAPPSAQAQSSGEGLIVLKGRTLDPDGKPLAGANLCLVSSEPDDRGTKFTVRAVAGADGRFSISLPTVEWESIRGPGFSNSVVLIAIADPHAPDWIAFPEPPGPNAALDLTLRMVRDDIPLVGRLADRDGKPIVGARPIVRAMQDDGGDLTRYLDLVRCESYSAMNHRFAKSFQGAWPGPASKATTDADGRFRLTGLGRERIVWLSFVGKGIGHEDIVAMTRAGKGVSSHPDDDPRVTIQAAEFQAVAPPGRALSGFVRDKTTGRPIAGVRVRSLETLAATVSDAQGRFSLGGLAKSKEYHVIANPSEGQPYFVTCLATMEIENAPKIEVDIACARGIPYRLKLTDRATGMPVAGAEVAYNPIYTNTRTGEVSGYEPIGNFGPYNRAKEESPGVYLSAVLPGPGALTIRVGPPGKYKSASVDPESFFRKADDPNALRGRRYGDRNRLLIAVGEREFASMPQDQFQAIVLINPAAESQSLQFQAMVEPDVKHPVQALGQDGKPIAAAELRAIGATIDANRKFFTVGGLAPGRPRDIWLFHDRNHLVGHLQAKAESPGPYSIPLQPASSLAGRLVAPDGKPRQGVTLRVAILAADRVDADSASSTAAAPWDRVVTDADGKFRIEGLVPGRHYSVAAFGNKPYGEYGPIVNDIVLQPGERKDLGDVKAASRMRREESNSPIR